MMGRCLRCKGGEGWKTSKRTADSWTRKGGRRYDIRGEARKTGERKKHGVKLCENICRRRGWRRASESAWDEGAEGDRRGRGKGGRRVERSITNGPGVVTLKRVNGEEPNFPPTHFFALHHQHLSLNSRKTPSPPFSPTHTPPVYRLLPPSLLTAPYIFRRFNTTLYFSSSW